MFVMLCNVCMLCYVMLCNVMYVCYVMLCNGMEWNVMYVCMHACMYVYIYNSRCRG